MYCWLLGFRELVRVMGREWQVWVSPSSQNRRGSDMSLPSQGSEKQTLSAVTLASCVALFVSFLGLSQFDLPIVRYMRSVTTYFSSEQLTITWLAVMNYVGNWIGSELHVVGLCLGLLALGWVRQQPSLIVAAVQSVIGLGMVTVVVNSLKHLIGRPRPKFTHTGDWHIGVAWDSGFDSFPSGHSAVSFVVATVLAKRFPVIGPFCLGVAAFAALSRIPRGSHFLTDVVAGAILGILSGLLAAAPLTQWRVSIADGLRHGAVGASMVLMILWVLARPMDDGMVGMLLLAAAAMAILGGLWLHRGHWSTTGQSPKGWQTKASFLLIASGLAALTTSPLVLTSVGLACLAVWFTPFVPSNTTDQPVSPWSAWHEGALLGGLIVGISLLIGAREVLPFQ